MKRATIAAVLAGAVAVFSSGAVLGQNRTDFGKAEYDANCAVCHGLSGKGEGSFGEVLKARMPDLTTIAKRNGGVFPVDRVVQTIDGSAMPKAHGSTEMPIWGLRYCIEGAPQYADACYRPEAFVRARILALVDYIYRLQTR